jgi:hypothetical protein
LPAKYGLPVKELSAVSVQLWEERLLAKLNADSCSFDEVYDVDLDSLDSFPAP